mmetsp:Transcript_11223/g.29918  ORF Transcript_11223/g.29918 Transcript_11223/m.29918 type:complete len:437 (+) Transcript_11223:678-1988(+)
MLFRELCEVVERRVVPKQGLQQLVLSILDGVFQEGDQPGHVGAAEVLDAEILFEVLVVIIAHVALVEGCALRIVQVATETVHEKVQLDAQGQQRPILEAEVRIQGFTIADVVHILDVENLNVLSIDLHWDILILLLILRTVLVLALLVALLLLGLLSLTLLFGRILLFFGLLVRGLLFIPLAEHLVPLRHLLLEPTPWLDALHALRELLLGNPLFEILLALDFFLPNEFDICETLGLLGDAEFRDGGRKLLGRQVLVRRLAEPLLLLLLGEHDRHFCLAFRRLLVLILLVLILFGHFFLLGRLFLAVLNVLLSGLRFPCPFRLQRLFLPELLRLLALDIEPLFLRLLLIFDLQQRLMHVLLESGVRFSHRHVRNCPELSGREAREEILALFGEERRPHVHDHEAAVGHWQNVVEHLPDPEFLHEGSIADGFAGNGP